MNLHAMDELRQAVAQHAGLRPVPAPAPHAVPPVPVTPAPEPSADPETDVLTDVLVDVLTAPAPTAPALSAPASTAPARTAPARTAPAALDCALPERWALRGAAMNRIVARAATHSPQGHEIARELADMIRGLGG